MAGKGLRAKLQKYAALDVPYFLFPALTFPEKCVNVPRSIAGLVSRRREVAPLAVGMALLAIGVTLWILPAVIVVEVVLLVDWAENDRSGKARRNHRTKRAVQNAFIQCREDRAKEHPIDSLPLYLNHGEFPPRSDPPVVKNDDGTTDEPSFRERLAWRWHHRSEQPHTVVVMLGLTPACDDVRLGKIAGQLGKYFHATCRFQNYRNGKAQLTIRHRDVLAKPVPYKALDVTPQQIPVGVNRYGLLVGRGLMDGGGGRSWLVFGQRGSGKTAFLNAVMADVLRIPHVELYIIDPLGGVDMGCWWEFAAGVATEPAEILKLLRERVAGIGGRQVAMTERKLQKVTDPTQKFPLRILVIDELADLTLNPDPNFRKEAISLLYEYNRKGRKTADVLIAATQDIRKDIVPGHLAGQFSDRFGLRCATAEMTQIGFGNKLDQLEGGDKINLAAIKESHKGRGFWLGANIEEIRAIGLYGDLLDVQVSRLSKEWQNRDQEGPDPVPSRVHGGPADDLDVSSLDTSESSPPPNGEGKQPRRDSLKETYDQIVKANGVGVTPAEIVLTTGLQRRTVDRNIVKLRQADKVENLLGSRYTAKERT